MKKQLKKTTAIASSLAMFLSTAAGFCATPYTVLAEENEIKTISADLAAENASLARRAGAEGTVLLKNENNALPLAKGSGIALLGMDQVRYVKGGTGSGGVNVSYIVNAYLGLKAKEEEGKIKIYQPLSQLYLDVYQNGEIEELAVDQSVIDAAAKEADTAILFIGRNSGEGLDRSAEKGDYYLTDQEIGLADQAIEAGFSHIVVVYNVGGMVDTSWMKDYPQIDGFVYAWQGGSEGGNSLADVLVGDANPSGKLTDTLAASYDAYPASSDLLAHEDYMEYQEDIYVGYRYFETLAPEEIVYPFGYGLSYTTFEFSDPEISVEDGKVNVTETITNTGDVAGKEVAQVYFSAPQGKLGKPAKELAAFEKTKELKPGESQTLTLSYDVEDMSSYDDLGKIQKSAYVMEAGDYEIYVGNSIADAGERGSAYTYQVAEDTVTEQLTEEVAPVALKQRLLADGSYEELPTGDAVEKKEYARFVSEEDKVDYNGDIDGEEKQDQEEKTEVSNEQEGQTGLQSGNQTGDVILLSDVKNGTANMSDFLAQLTDEDLVSLSGGQPCTGVADTGGIGNLPEYGIPNAMTADGPAGIRLNMLCTAFPCGTMQACTWNTELVEEIGVACAKEAIEAGIDIWLAPGMNIHRDPLCGRNFEYYSEDPVVAGKMAAALTTGVQSQGVSITIKHFAANNREYNRRGTDSRMSERALREIYLKGFEICVKEADPWCIMSSYNWINGTQTAENYELLTNILRGEWGWDGVVMTDWGNDSLHVKEAIAGNDVKMRAGDPDALKAALEDGTLTRYELVRNVRHILEMIMKTNAME